jgi:hypothetical protein
MFIKNKLANSELSFHEQKEFFGQTKVMDSDEADRTPLSGGVRRD